MKIANKIIKVLNQVPPDYYQKGTQNNLLQKYWHSEKIQVFKRITKSLAPKTILDVGCAGGLTISRIARIFPKAKIVGIDAYPAAISYASKMYPKISFVQADAHKLPFENNSFDLVVCYETIEHVVKPLSVLKELIRIVKPSGRVIVAMDSGNLMFRAIWFIWENTKGRVWKYAHLHPYKHRELESVIKKSGFKITSKNFSHFGMEVIFVLKK